MTNALIRRNVYDLGGDWADPILWYARAVKVIKARPLADPTSWRFYGAIHGIWRELWDFYNITTPADPSPSPADTATFLNQCQHQSWYFLPWHRGYLIALENLIRAEIKNQGGPHDTWSLPYWNYFGNGQNILPPAFRTPDWPDGTGDNPLFVVQRWGVMGGTQPFDITTQTNLNQLGDPEFTGGGGNVGFGGPETGFSWSGTIFAGVEHNPHNFVHGLVGGDNPFASFPNGDPLPGLMSNPLSAALDPIFYLHHCNIDRLWESWNKFPAGKPAASPTDWQNPTVPKWLGGPLNIGEREFVMPKPDASRWAYKPEEMQDIAALGYTYDDLTPGAVVTPQITLAARMSNLGIAASTAAANGGATVAVNSKVEMVGASDIGLRIAGSGAVSTVVNTLPEARARVSQSLVGALGLPDRVFLNLENITGVGDATIFQVYVGLPDGADPAANKDHLAGGVSLFGVRQASDPVGKHAGSGLSITMEITALVDKLHLEGNFDIDALPIRIVPFGNIPETARIRIGRISIYRQFD